MQHQSLYFDACFYHQNLNWGGSANKWLLHTPIAYMANMLMLRLREPMLSFFKDHYGFSSWKLVLNSMCGQCTWHCRWDDHNDKHRIGCKVQCKTPAVLWHTGKNIFQRWAYYKILKCCFSDKVMLGSISLLTRGKSKIWSFKLETCIFKPKDFNEESCHICMCSCRHESHY